MTAEIDLQIIEEQPPVKLSGEGFDEFDDIKSYKGKFVVTDDARLFAKLYPKDEWDNAGLFHDMVVGELGVQDPKSVDVRDVITGGGKIEIESMGDHAECRLYGTSTVYGNYNPDDIDIPALETEIREKFVLADMPVLVIPDFKE